MSKIQSIKLMFVTGLFAAVSILSIAMSPSALAVSCSGNGCNGTNPYTTGCSQNAFLVARYYFADARNGVYFIYPNDIELDVYYSRSCGTNWTRVTKNPYGGNTRKVVSLANAPGTTLIENDYGYSASYSTQLYAPGSTRILVSSYLYDTAGNARAYVLAKIL